MNGNPTILDVFAVLGIMDGVDTSTLNINISAKASGNTVVSGTISKLIKVKLSSGISLINVDATAITGDLSDSINIWADIADDTVPVGGSRFFTKYPSNYVKASIGTYTDSQLEQMWLDLTNVPFDETEDGRLVLAEDWEQFPAGTDREDIWYFFDDNYSKGVAYLLYDFEG